MRAGRFLRNRFQGLRGVGTEGISRDRFQRSGACAGSRTAPMQHTRRLQLTGPTSQRVRVQHSMKGQLLGVTSSYFTGTVCTSPELEAEWRYLVELIAPGDETLLLFGQGVGVGMGLPRISADFL